MASDTGLGIASEAIRIVVEPNTFVIIGGTALGTYAKRLTVLRGADQWQLTGRDQVLTYDNTTYLSFPPVNEKAAYFFLFETAKSGSDFVDSEYARDFKATKHIVPKFATYYTIHTEDGGDNDFHDITLTVALIGASKVSNVSTGVARVAYGIPNVTVSTTQNNSRVSVATPGVASRTVSATRGRNPSTSTTRNDSRGSLVTPGFGNRNVSATRGRNPSTSTTRNDSRGSLATQGVESSNVSVTGTRGLSPFTSTTGDNSRVPESARSRKVSITSEGPYSSTSSSGPGGLVDGDWSVVSTDVDSTSVDVKTDADVESIPTGAFTLRNVYTNCELTAVIDTSPAMMFPTGSVPVQWRTWNIEADGSGRVFMSNQVKNHRYLQEGASLVETGDPKPVRLIRAVTQGQECYYISTEQLADETIVLSDPSPLGIPGAKLQTNVLEIDAPPQLWVLTPVS